MPWPPAKTGQRLHSTLDPSDPQTVYPASRPQPPSLGCLQRCSRFLSHSQQHCFSFLRLKESSCGALIPLPGAPCKSSAHRGPSDLPLPPPRSSHPEEHEAGGAPPLFAGCAHCSCPSTKWEHSLLASAARVRYPKPPSPHAPTVTVTQQSLVTV